MDTLLDKPIGDVTFTVLDVETTGLEPYLGHRICEIGLVKFCNTEEPISYSSLINPERSIPDDVIVIHGITNQMVKNAPIFKSIASDVLSFIDGTVLVAHNANFDLGFIVKHLRQTELPIPNNLVIDTLTIARKYFHFPNNCLITIASSLEIDTKGEHRALKDATIAKEVFQYFIKKLKVKTMRELLDLQGGSIPFPETAEVITPPVIDEYIKTGRKLIIKYISASGEQTERIVTPIELNRYKNTEYLIAFCHLRNEERAFRIDRILESHPITSNG